MGGGNWKRKMIAGLAVIALLGGIALPAWAGDTIPIKAVLIKDCVGFCKTDAGGWVINTGFFFFPGTYSVIAGYPDTVVDATGDGTANDGVYCPFLPCMTGEQSNILTHNTVYTLDTTGTLVNGLVSPGFTRTIHMHFYTTATNTTPACWNDANRTDLNNDFNDETQAVNWSILSQNSMPFTNMVVGTPYPGTARLNFNVRNGVCENTIYRFTLKWAAGTGPTTGGGGITITQLPPTAAGKRQWMVTTDQYGTAGLTGQGGKGNTIDYGQWRLPFKILLIEL